METIQKKSPSTKAPLSAPKVRKVLLAPGVYAKIPSKPLAKTQLGRVAQLLVEQSNITTLSVAATTGYVYAITESSSPIVQFQDVPPNMPSSSLQQLQTAYTTFMNQYSLFQGQASAWVSTQPGSSSNSILSQLVSLPTTLNNINGTVTSNFTLLAALTPGSEAYQNVLTQQENLIGAESASITQLITTMQNFGNNMETSSTALVASTQTGILSQMLAAYATDIQSLTNDIDTANQKIAADNKKIIGEGVGAAVSVGVALFGLFNLWNPLGWILLAAGATGAYFAITEIEVLKVQVSQLKGQIQNDITYKTLDEAAAQTMASFSNQVQGFASMNQASQAELTALENVYSTLSSDIALAIQDLDQNELDDAKNEWAQILSEASFLAGLTAYLWPSSALLSASSVLAGVGSNIYAIGNSGEMFQYTASSNTWADMNVKSLSVVGAGSTLIAIDGAPIDGSQAGGNNVVSTYFVKSYDMSGQTWTTISNFPAAAIATNGATIYAVNQTVTDRQVYQYSGSGTNWTKLAPLPGPDAATQIAVAGGVLFTIANNSQFLYQYNSANSTWTQVATFTCASIIANGNKLGIVDTNNNAYVYDPTSGAALLNAGAYVASIAQLSDGTQFRISSLNLSLWFANTNANPITYTQLESNSTSVFASDTNVVYYIDNTGNLYTITSGGVTTLLPALPNS